MLLAAGLLCVGSLVVSVCQSFGVLLLGRALQGLGSGASWCACSVYITEIAPSRYRGALVAISVCKGGEPAQGRDRGTPHEGGLSVGAGSGMRCLVRGSKGSSPKCTLRSLGLRALAESVHRSLRFGHCASVIVLPRRSHAAPTPLPRRSHAAGHIDQRGHPPGLHGRSRGQPQRWPPGCEVANRHGTLCWDPAGLRLRCPVDPRHAEMAGDGRTFFGGSGGAAADCQSGWAGGQCGGCCHRGVPAQVARSPPARAL